MKKLLQILIVLIVFVTNILATFAETPEIDSGTSCILVDSKTGQVLYEYNSNAKGLYPASTTKIMTAALAIEKDKLDTVMTASQAAVDDIGKDGSNIGIMAGEQITLENLLQALLISSANETANIIAENTCATRQEFVDLMNSKAKELGALDTHFVNPCGAHEPNHYTTVGDLAKIARYAMTFPKFREIVKKVNYQLPPTNKHATWPVLATTNKLMQSTKSDKYEIIGIKTGYTGPAGYNLVSAAVNAEGMELISVVMHVKNDGAQSNVKKYTKELLDYGFDSFSLVTVESDNKVYRSVTVEDSDDGAPLDLVTKGEVKYVLPKNVSAGTIQEITHINSPITAPVNKGDYMGSVEFKNNGTTIGKVDLLASRDVKLKPHAELTNNVEVVLGNRLLKTVIVAVCILVPSFFFLRIILRMISRKINAKKKSE